MKLELPWVNPNLPENRKKEEEKNIKDPNYKKELDHELNIKKIIGKLDLEHADRAEALEWATLFDHIKNSSTKEERSGLKSKIEEVANKKLEEIEAQQVKTYEAFEDVVAEISKLKRSILKKSMAMALASDKLGKEIQEDDVHMEKSMGDIPNEIEKLNIKKEQLLQEIEKFSEKVINIDKIFHPTNEEIRNN
jgi:membrane-associated HD superfamily phosphohydrolase